MAEEQDQEKNLPASERRIQQAREEGNIPRSREFPGGAILLGAIVLLYASSDGLVNHSLGLMRTGLSLSRQQAFDPNSMAIHWMGLLTESLWILLPVFAVTLLLGVFGNVVVGGFILTPQKLAPDFSKINPAKGLSNIFSGNGLAELLKAFLKTVVLGFVGYLLVKSHMAEFNQMSALPLSSAIAKTGTLTIKDAMWLAAIFLVLVAIDVPYQLWRYYRGMRMSLEELKREAKESEGDPHMKARIRSLQRQAARKRMMAAIPKADVVVTNPTHFSVALTYKDGQGAPRVVAKGRGELALKIREIARSSKVPVIEMPPLARSLYTHVELDQEIPSVLYTVVAKLLAYVFAMGTSQIAHIHMPQEEDIPAGMDPGPVTDEAEDD